MLCEWGMEDGGSFMNDKEKELVRRFREKILFDQEEFVNFVSLSETAKIERLKQFIAERTEKLNAVKINIQEQLSRINKELIDLDEINATWQ